MATRFLSFKSDQLRSNKSFSTLTSASLLSLHPENYRLQSAYENNLIIKMVFVSNAFFSVCARK